MKTVNRRRTPASNNRAHADLGDSLKRKLQNPEFRAAYDAEESASNWCSRSSSCGSGAA